MPNFKIINNRSEITLSNEWVPSAKFNSKDRLVNAGGKISPRYEGVQYRIIEKRERIFSITERIRRGFLGTLVVVSTLSLGLFSKSVQDLFIKSKENVRFGVLSSSEESELEITDAPKVFENKIQFIEVQNIKLPCSSDLLTMLRRLKKEDKEEEQHLEIIGATRKEPKNLRVPRNGESKKTQFTGVREVKLPCNSGLSTMLERLNLLSISRVDSQTVVRESKEKFE